MKFSIFKKVALWLLIIISAVEIIMFAVLYTYTYNKAVSEATGDIREAAKSASEQISFYDPNALTKKDIGEDTYIPYTLDNLCEQYGIDMIMFLLPDTQNNTVRYLRSGLSNKIKNNYTTYLYLDDYTPGSYIVGGMTEEMKKAFAGDDSGVTAHIKNGNEDKLVCYMPVIKTYFADENGERYDPTITSLISAEISLNKVMTDINKRFREFAAIMVVVTITVGISAVVILYFRVSKPLKKISSKMKGFVSEQDVAFEKLPVKGNDEFAEMSDSFNTMADELERYINDVAELNRQKTELNIAQNIQMGLLEPPSFRNNTVVIKASMMTAKDVGGDLYYYHILENGSVFVAIGDVSGKGITAALFMSRAITLLNQYAKSAYSPAKILFEFNNDLVGHNPNMMFITAFIAIYNPKTEELTYSNAGHNYPYLVSDQLIPLNAENGIIAGLFTDSEFPEYSVRMKTGDRLFLYTDGITEAENNEGDFFGEERLEKVLCEHIDCDAEGLLNSVSEEISAFVHGAEQSDDMTMLTLQIAPVHQTQHLHLEAETENLEKINHLISNLDLPDALLYMLNIIAEEVFVNICSYAYPDRQGEIDFTLTSNDSKIVMTFEDSGIPFDPSENRVNIDEYTADPTVGGLGRHIALTGADHYTYERKEGKSVLRLFVNNQSQ